jgi:hypothetical protein
MTDHWHVMLAFHARFICAEWPSYGSSMWVYSNKYIVWC